jgi:hypothetical protein
LSNASSDETPAEWLSATLEFTVTGGAALGGQTLSLTVTNNTGMGGETPEFALSQIFFNSAAGVGLTPTGGGLPTGWSWGSGHAGGFGIFDFHLETSEAGGSPGAIAAGASLTFGFDIVHDGEDVAANDFTTELSSIPPGGRPAIAAAKFIQGPGDDSGYGAYIPLPPALPMGIAGLLGVAVLGRRKRARIINPG